MRAAPDTVRRPEEPEYHLFSIDIESASFAVIQDGDWVRKLWKEEG